MDNREAIQLLDELLLRGNFTDQYGDMEDSSPYEEAVEIARQAIEKQIPKKLKTEMLHEAFSDDLISRQAAIDFIKDHSYPVRYDGNSIEQGMTVTGIEEALNEIPNIQSKQKTGQWLINSDGYYPYCSECMNEPQNRIMTDYCSNCGAYMKGENND